MINYEKEYWNWRYKNGGNSGAGSYGNNVERKLNWIKEYIKDIDTITEIGCGDFNFGKQLTEMFPDAKYTGTDVADEIVKRNAMLYPMHTFKEAGEYPTADLVLCVDVFLHVIEDEEYEKLLDELDKMSPRYLVVSAYEYDQEFTNHVRIRKFDYKRFGEPVLREVCEEDGQMYFYIYDRSKRS